MSFLMIALGGGGGALLRYGLQTGISFIAPGFPLGTMFANLLGCFAAGCLYPLSQAMPESLRFFLVVGFLGALTTFSSFSVEVNALLLEKRVYAAFLHWSMNAFGCCGASFLGIWLVGRWI